MPELFTNGILIPVADGVADEEQPGRVCVESVVSVSDRPLDLLPNPGGPFRLIATIKRITGIDVHDKTLMNIFDFASIDSIPQLSIHVNGESQKSGAKNQSRISSSSGAAIASRRYSLGERPVICRKLRLKTDNEEKPV